MSNKIYYDQVKIRTEIIEFITNNFLFGDKTRLPSDESSLLDNGIMDSTGVLELIEFLEDKFLITVAESETLPENLGSVSNLLGYLAKKIT